MLTRACLALAQPEVHALTEADIAAGTYSIEDVVMPLPGCEVKYPAHECGEPLARELLEADGMGVEAFAQPESKYRMLRLPGAYRHIVQRPRDVQWELKTYTSGNQQLVETDFDRLRRRGLVPEVVRAPKRGRDDARGDAGTAGRAGGAGGGNGEAGAGDAGEAEKAKSDAAAAATPTPSAALDASMGDDAAQEEEPSQLALQVSFSLGRSCYATMCIRELTKMSTAQHEQAQLMARAATGSSEARARLAAKPPSGGDGTPAEAHAAAEAGAAAPDGSDADSPRKRARMSEE